MKKQPKVSVVVPIYGVEKYLHQCVDSILAQTLTDIEIILVDDGSKDKCPQICDEYAKKDSRVVAIHQPNGGYGRAVNHGIEVATGEYIGIVEPDDWIATDMYEQLYSLSKNKSADIVKSNFYKFNKKNKTKVKKFKNIIKGTVYKNTDIPTFITEGHPCIWSAIYKNDLIKKIKLSETPGAAFQDVGLNIKTWCHAKSIVITEDAFYHYRTDNENSSINQGNKMAFITVKEYHRIFKYLQEQRIDKILLNIIIKKCIADVKHNYNTRLTNKHIKFILLTSKLFKKMPNIKIDDSFYKRIKEHPYKSILFSKKTVSAFEKKYYILGFNIYSVIKNETHKIFDFNIFRIKKRKYKETSISNNNDIINGALFNIVQDRLIEKNKDEVYKINEYLKMIKNIPDYLHVDSEHNYLNILLNKKEFKCDRNKKDINCIDDVFLCWEIRPSNISTRILTHAMNLNKKVLFVGDSFLRSIDTFAEKKSLPKYKKGISFTIDDLTCYFDATRINRLENMLNDKNLILSDKDIDRAKFCINKIVTTHLTKYNSQPIYTPQIGRADRKKVLVVDQSFGDMSIIKGYGNQETFKKMLELAVSENPDADIIIKTHPDTIAGKSGYYTGLTQHDNIYTQTTPINPISLIKYVDKVYVCSTQFGFEALMCGKEVRVFGMPFYAGWGLTQDEQICERRTNKRTLEEIFYIAYIMYSYYVNPDKGCRCEIEEAMDYLLNLRKEYFDKYNIINELENNK